MIFTGKNLSLIRSALKRAISDCRTDIGHLEHVRSEAEESEELEAEIAMYKRLLAHIDAQLKGE